MKTKSNWRSAIITIPFLLACAGCGGGGGGNPTGIEVANCSVQGQNEFVYDVMQDLYLYYDQLPVVDPGTYSSPKALLDDLIVAPDRFSFIDEQQRRDDFFEAGTYNGIGFGFENNDDNYTLTFVYNDSSAGRAGLQRGDQIVSIEGVAISQINTDGGLRTFLTDYDDGEAITFAISSAGAEPVNRELSKGLVRINTVLKNDVIATNNLKVGYLAFSSFIQPSEAELATAFGTLHQQNIDELVLDLRYNGGGRVDVAQTLASYITGENALGAAVAKLVYNDKNSDLNRSFPFRSIENELDLKRLYVLTLEGTCSASELLINAMSPVGIEVITIGQTSCGKPVGSRSINFCDKTLVPISFNVANDINQGDYFDGIAATCAANDDTSSLFADPNESMFATALYHIENDQCPVVAKASARNLLVRKSGKLKSQNPNPADIMRSVY